MLIRKEHTKDGGLLGIWKIEEQGKSCYSFFPGIYAPKPTPTSGIFVLKGVR